MAHVCFLHETWGLLTTSLGETDNLKNLNAQMTLLPRFEPGQKVRSKERPLAEHKDAAQGAKARDPQQDKQNENQGNLVTHRISPAVLVPGSNQI